MIVLKNIKVDVVQDNDRKELIQLLSIVSLPFEDLPESLDTFLIIKNGEEIIGSVGIEIFGKYGLLRSLATHPDYRNIGIANILYEEIIMLAKENKVKEMYLITNTAQNYFSPRGFKSLSREEVPQEIKATAQFKSVCPTSAIVMTKMI